MANKVIEGGLRLVEPKAMNNSEIVLISSNDSNNMGLGDPVQEYAANAGSIGSGPSVMQVAQGTATSAVYGVVQSYLAHYSDGTGVMNLSQVYRSASTAEYALIRVGNNEDIYEITDDGVLAGLTSGHLNYNYKFIASACDTANGMSKFQIDSNNGANTATYPIQVIGASLRQDNDPTLANASWRVRLNNVIRSGGTGTLGV